jgi:hypothetical protein
MKAQSLRAMATTILLGIRRLAAKRTKREWSRFCAFQLWRAPQGLPALAVREFFADLGRRPVMFGTFNEDPPRVGVAR